MREAFFDRKPAQVSGERRREAFLILGMHRSGTSAMAGTLVRLGIAPPKTLLAPAEENPKGFYESGRLTPFHDELLASAGSKWDDWRPFNDDWFKTPIADEYTARAKVLLDDEFEGAGAFVLKDPRICRFARFWLDIFTQVGIDPKLILPFRSPLEVAQSLRTRNGFPIRKGLLLWLRHVLDAEAATRYQHRSLVDWKTFLSNWRSGAKRVAAELDVCWPALTDYAVNDIENFLSDDLWRERIPEDELSTNADVHRWVLDAYAALQELSRQPESTEPQIILDAIRSRFNEACGVFGGVVLDAEVAFEKLRADRDSAIRTLDEALHSSRAQIERLTHLVQSTQASAIQKEEALRVEMANALENERKALHAQMEARLEAVHRLYQSSTSWKVTRPLRAVPRIYRK
jgi:hypothetical protein